MPVPSMLDSQLRHGGEEAERATEAIREALVNAKGVIPPAAEALGVSTRTLFRMLKTTDLTDYAAQLRQGAGVRLGRGPQKLQPSTTSMSQKKRARKSGKRQRSGATA